MILKKMQMRKPDGSMGWAVKAGDAAEPVLVCDTEEACDAYIAKNKGDSASSRVARIDTGSGTLRAPVKLANGMLKVDGYLTRTGVFEYRNDDGTKRREYRSPAEVFKQDSLDTFAMAPVTDDHPDVFLTAKNATEHQRGSIGDSVTRDGDFMRARMLITDHALVKKLETGKAVEISNGYTCDLVMKPGVTEQGEKYDAIQTNIICNHVAIVPSGRAGPQARVRMDSGDGVMVSISNGVPAPAPEPVPPARVTNVNKIKVDGIEYDEGSAQAAAALAAFKLKVDAAEKVRADAEAKVKLDAEKAASDLKKLQDDNAKLQAKADADAEKLKKLDAELKAAPGAAVTAMKARMALEASAAGILGKKFKFDGLDDKAIKVATLKKAEPDLKLDGKADAYIDARFDIAIEEKDAEDEEDREDGGEGTEDGIDAARRVVTDDEDDREPGDPEGEMTLEEANKPHKDSGTAREAMLVRNRNQWREPIGNERAE